MRVSLTDTGAGVAPEYRQEIFEDFVKLPAGSENNAGMGWAWPLQGALFKLTEERSGWKEIG